MTIGQPDIEFFNGGDGTILGYRLRKGHSPTLLFLPGYASDMDGAKALALDAFAGRQSVGMLRFDYSGTGSSGSDLAHGTLTAWLGEALAMVDQLTDGPLILIGSSMGGWLALHLALQRPQRVQALIGIAAAPDFTDWGFTPEQKSQFEDDALDQEPNPYVSRGFWRSGAPLLLLGGDIAIDCPVRLIHGDQDGDVPLDVAMRLTRQLRSADVQLKILKDGGHRLSEPHEIEAILRTVHAFLEPCL